MWLPLPPRIYPSYLPRATAGSSHPLPPPRTLPPGVELDVVIAGISWVTLTVLAWDCAHPVDGRGVGSGFYVECAISLLKDVAEAIVIYCRAAERDAIKAGADKSRTAPYAFMVCQDEATLLHWVARIHLPGPIGLLACTAPRRIVQVSQYGATALTASINPFRAEFYFYVRHYDIAS